MNWYPEIMESGNAKSAIAMYPVPGLKIFVTIKGPVRGQFAWNSRMFAVGGDTVYEITYNSVTNIATAAVLGTVPNDNLPVTFAANNAQQMIVCSGGQLWLFPLGSSATQT